MNLFIHSLKKWRRNYATIALMLEKLNRIASSFVRIPAAGVDISDKAVKYLRLSPGHKINFDFWGEIALPQGIIENGEIKKEDELTNIIKEKYPRNKKNGLFNSSYIISSLPEEKGFIRVIQLPKVKTVEMASAIKWELEANVPVPLGELYFDYEIIQSAAADLDHYDVLIVAYPKTIVDSYSNIFKKAGLLPIAFESEAQSMVRALAAGFDPKEAVIIADMGATRTTFIVFGGGTIILTITINFGGQSIHLAIAKNLGISLEEAEKIKKEVGLNKKEKEGKLYEVLIWSLGVLVDELKRQIWYYQDHLSHRHGASPKITKVYLCGGEASLIGLVPYLNIALSLPIIIADPFVSIKSKMVSAIPPIAKNKALGFTTVLGLAERAIE